jgi:hypothetical protein
LTENTIPDFLGPEICNSSIIKNSKLTNDEKLLLDNLFSVEELDQAVEDAKSTTAGGPDGIGNKCIKKIWPYIRVPLTNYANCCIEKEHLTDNFRTALIKLIPKKGDVSKIGNWRPISLLNCMYKVISKAITMRLQKISNRIFSRAQKGFTDDKYIQECLINIVETIKRCNDFNIPAFILAIDQAKAFDSVRHDFMRKCLEFFEVPERFIKILEIFTTNRTAAILLEGGKCSKTFDLEIGNTQGNGPSPIQFNICEQILLFKLELDPRIQSIYSDFANIPIILHQRPLKDFSEQTRDNFHYENNRETNKVEGFADDGTVMTLATPAAIEAIRETLNNFEVISGLSCNVNKSVILPAGFGGENLPDFLTTCGFPIVTEVTILGVKISSDFNTLYTNFDDKIEKIKRIRNFWSRFRLSLPGRILVAKTFMLSQIGYLGCILKPKQEQMKSFSETINNFIKGSLNISKDRLTTEPVDGGVGMINVNHYVIALQAAWFKKIRGCINDNWRRDIYTLTHGVPVNSTVSLYGDCCSPVLAEMSSSLDTVKKAFYTNGNNLLCSNIVNNPVLDYGERRETVANVLKNNRPNLAPDAVANLKVSDFWGAGTGIKRLEEICDNTGLNVSLLTYMRIGRILTPHCHNLTADPPPENIEKILGGKKKGSKQIRKYLYKENIKKKRIEISKLRQVTTFFDLIGLPVPNTNVLKFIHTLWTFHFLPNKIREFGFKFYNNILGLNTRVANFNQAVNRNCTLCTRGGGLI